MAGDDLHEEAVGAPVASSSTDPAPAAAPAATPAADAAGASAAVGPFSVPTPVDEIDVEVAEAEAAVESDLDVLVRERDEYLDALRRLQADFENFKKRTMKQQTDHLERAAQHLAAKLLPVLDAADLAIAHEAGEAVAQVAGLLMDTLVKEGLEGVDPRPGDPFDPMVHEAVAHEPGEGGAQEVADLLRAGYRWKGVLLRPAMVKVRG